MKILDLTLNAVIVVSATVLLAYVGLYHFDFGLFTTLPGSIVGFFTRNEVIQYGALGLVIAAPIAKAHVGRAISRKEAERGN
ncbi:hypothetical protein [Occultella kanbiaonis]|uniref:hypothetical protein n=1 Tax=Occultella kanbiaonis TaxID=2675754 RepID=UPI0013D80789|nr:hypothetical protein [Occultella kanbiaonis]